MSEAFDAYRKWLGIPPAEQPPNHYRLLAIAPFEQDADVIETAADLRMSHLRTYQTGPHSALSQKLLNEVAAAKLCLLDPSKKAAYDTELRRRVNAAERTMQTVPIATSLAPMAVRATAPAPSATAAPQIAFDFPLSRSVTPDEDGPSEPSAIDVKVAQARSKLQFKPEHRGLALAAAGGITIGFLLGWLTMSARGTRASTEVRTQGGTRETARSLGKPTGESGPGGSLQNEMAKMLKSIERPSPLGVVAEKLVIWNTHNGTHNDFGALECNVRLFAGEREVWSKVAVAVPWAPNQDRSVTLALPQERFDRARVEITKWEKLAGGLAEIQVLSADGRNLALGCPALASGVWNRRFNAEHVTDGVTASSQFETGFWLLPRGVPGWVEVDLSLHRPATLAGVVADELVIWNQHNGPHNNSGTRTCDVTLLSGPKTAWRQEQVELPWAPGQDAFVKLKLPNVRFDRARIDVTPREGQWAGLTEAQVLRNGENLALDSPATATAVFDEWRSGSRVTDGVVSSAVESVGYWLLPLQGLSASVEIDLSCLDAKYGAACRQLGLALALVDGDWQRGLLWLARGDDRTLRRLALTDSHDLYDTPDQLAVADRWWELAQQADGAVQKQLLARSLWRYRQALHKLREFRRNQIQARFDQALPDLPERDYLYFMPESEFKGIWDLRHPVSVSVQGVRSYYGLWMHPGVSDSSHAGFRLDKRYRRLRGAAAMNDSAAGMAATALTFRIVGDGRELWKSRPLKGSGESHLFHVDVARVDKLELFVDCPGGNGWCHGVWVEPHLER